MKGTHKFTLVPYKFMIPIEVPYVVGMRHLILPSVCWYSPSHSSINRIYFSYALLNCEVWTHEYLVTGGDLSSCCCNRSQAYIS